MSDGHAVGARTAVTPGMRVALLGATGTIGSATRRVLRDRGCDLVCLGRRPPDAPDRDGNETAPTHGRPMDAFRRCDVTDPDSLARDGLRGEKFDAIVSCLASRTGKPADAWAIDHDANATALSLARDHGVKVYVLLSAICVQKPMLQFQFAKLEFEKKLAESGLAYAIVRPTAFFKSLSGQIDRVRAGKAFLIFGDGKLTACKPIGNEDLANYLVDCLQRPEMQNRILPIGGPGPAISPLEQGERLFRLLDRPPRFRRVPVGMMSGIAGVLAALGAVSTKAADAAELARIARYYATESMLLYDPQKSAYDADATPSYGSQTLFDHYRDVIEGAADMERVDTALF